MPHVKRHLLIKIQKLLQMFPCIAIIGARQVGKSTLVKMATDNNWEYFDLEKIDDYQLISTDPVSFFKRKSKNIIIDEAQQYPELFKILRSVIDEDRDSVGRFILTGSSSPEIIKGLSESLAGRIATLELSPFSMSEYYDKPLSPLYEIITNTESNLHSFQTLQPQINLEQAYTHWFSGGYPEPRIKSQSLKDFDGLWKDQYFNDYIRRDIGALFPKINPHKFGLFIQTLSFHSGTSINKSTVSRSLEVSSVTVNDYLEIIHNTFLWRNLRSFEKNSLKKVQKMPKGFFRDSGILHHILKLSSIDQLLVHPQAGFSFESFVTEEVIRGIQALNVSATDFYFYRTKDKSEVDLVIDGPFGYIPIEIKLGRQMNKKMLAGLETFIKDTSSKFGLLINSSDKVEQLSDKIIQIPVGCL